jgi:PmbA protein
MNVDTLIDTILSKAGATADAAEIFYESSESRPVEFENNAVKYVATKGSRGVGLRVIKDGRIGFSSTSDFSRLDELVENALESATFGQEAKFEFPDCCEPAPVAVFDDTVPACTTKQMAELGQSAIDAVRANHPDVQCQATYTAAESEERVANTRGLDVGHRSTTYSRHVHALSVSDDGFLWVGDGRNGCRFDADDAAIVDKVVSDLDLARTVTRIETGRFPVIFTPDAVGTLLISLSQGVNGKLVQKGASPLADRIGEQIADERITVYDDALVDYAASSAPHDTEGLTATRTTLVQKGVLKSFIYDLQTAGILGAEPTGNGLRGYGSRPSPSHDNTVFEPGDVPFEQMLAGIRRGLLVDQVLGGGQSNTLAGEFSVNVELGFLIENGRPVGRAKDCMIFGNVYDLLRDGVEAIGDRCVMKGSLSLPHICFKDVSVSAQASDG